MNYQQTINFLFSQLPAFHRIGKAAYKADLNNSVKLDEYFGHPHLKFKSVHVAGTNGKGSVSHMLASVLQEEGYKTGLYTSPHLKDFRERIRIDGKIISKKDVIEFVNIHKAVIETIKPSFFELAVAMAFNHFDRNGVEVAIVETGLGGRLDSTNIITPILSVITNIGHDHLDLLGPTLEDVASEKSGIIKHSVPVVIGETQPWSENVFRLKSEQMNSAISFADRNYVCTGGEFNSGTGRRKMTVISTTDKKKTEVDSFLGGDYQEKNIPVVFNAIDILNKVLKVKDSSLIDGIRKVGLNTGLKGRWQQIGKDPLVICDTGHNREGIEYVLKQVAKTQKAKLHIVIGFVNDKDLSSVLPLFPQHALYYFTRASVPRALDEQILSKEASVFGLHGQSFPDVRGAYNAAKAAAGKEDMIFIGGSTFVVAEIV